jgi:hypothetical protein
LKSELRPNEDFYSYEKVTIFQIEMTPFNFYNGFIVNMHVTIKRMDRNVIKEFCKNNS